METTIWQEFPQDEVLLLGISNTNNSNIINNFVEENNLTYPILFDPGSPGGVQGGNTYQVYYLPNDGSPYPRDFIVDQEGVLQYANNEIDTEWMLYVLDELTGGNQGMQGDINGDGILNILDLVSLVNLVLSGNFEDFGDINGDEALNILDVVLLANLILNG